MNSQHLPITTVADPLPEGSLVSRPPQVVVALTLEVAWVLLTAVAMILSWIHNDLEESTTRLVMTLALMLIMVGWLLYKIYVGRNWARILLLLLSIPFPFTLLYDTTEAVALKSPIPANVLGIIGYGITIAVLWLLFTRPASSWFESHRAPAA